MRRIGAVGPTALAILERRRQIECRLTTDRALGTLEDAAQLLKERGMLTRMPDCALPSLFGACHEQPVRAGGRGFDLWPKSKWIWSFQLPQRPGAVLTKLHRGKSLYLSLDAARMFDPLVRRAIEAATDDDARLLEHLGKQGPSMTEDVELELGWDRRRLKQVRGHLERVGAVISDGLVFEDSSSWHFAPMRRWDQAIPKAKVSDDLYGQIVMAGFRAAVLAQEKDIGSWFSWPIPAGVLNRLVEEDRLVRPAPGWLAIANSSVA